jgi:16S rRNA (adenine1518-N6/adenine1519-N6)-dimethyltransferase
MNLFPEKNNFSNVRPKKHLGQHFLTDTRIAEKIIDALTAEQDYPLVEVGPGKGILTQFLIHRENFLALEVDNESVRFLHEAYPHYRQKILANDFFSVRPQDLFDGKEFYIIGNFPYHLSGELMEYFFRNRRWVKGVVGMFQKEVAERICAQPGSKAYGIFSVLLQTYYRAKYLFTVKEGSFHPPPKVKSGVILLERFRTRVEDLNEDEWEFIIRKSFGQRRKMLSNSLKEIFDEKAVAWHEFFSKRPEQLSCDDFISLARFLSGFSR